MFFLSLSSLMKADSGHRMDDLMSQLWEKAAVRDLLYCRKIPTGQMPPAGPQFAPGSQPQQALHYSEPQLIHQETEV